MSRTPSDIKKRKFQKIKPKIENANKENSFNTPAVKKKKNKKINETANEISILANNQKKKKIAIQIYTTNRMKESETEKKKNCT